MNHSYCFCNYFSFIGDCWGAYTQFLLEESNLISAQKADMLESLTMLGIVIAVVAALWTMLGFFFLASTKRTLAYFKKHPDVDSAYVHSYHFKVARSVCVG
jgi:uncharacterized protein YneF (UPF0154 family)